MFGFSLSPSTRALPIEKPDLGRSPGPLEGYETYKVPDRLAGSGSPSACRSEPQDLNLTKQTEFNCGYYISSASHPETRTFFPLNPEQATSSGSSRRETHENPLGLSTFEAGRADSNHFLSLARNSKETLLASHYPEGKYETRKRAPADEAISDRRVIPKSILHLSNPPVDDVRPLISKSGSSWVSSNFSRDSKRQGYSNLPLKTLSTSASRTTTTSDQKSKIGLSNLEYLQLHCITSSGNLNIGQDQRKMIGNRMKEATSDGESLVETIVYRYYSCQTWLNDTEKLSMKASFVSQILAFDLLRKISSLTNIHQLLDGMQESHNILIPFLYKLALKGLNLKRWKRVVKIWGNFWKLHHEKVKVHQPENILRTYVWISDYIYEITHPNLYRNFQPQLRGKKSARLRGPSSRLIKDISISNFAIYPISQETFESCIEHIYQCFIIENFVVKFERLPKDIVRKSHGFVLDKIGKAGERVMRLITKKTNNPKADNLIKKIVIKDIEGVVLNLLNTSYKFKIDLSDMSDFFENFKESDLFRISQDNFNLNDGIDLYEFKKGISPDTIVKNISVQLEETFSDYGTPKFQFLPLKINLVLKKFLIEKNP